MVSVKNVARIKHKIPLIDQVLPVKSRNCYGMDPDLFTGYDGETTSDRIFRESDAKAVCAGCALIGACLQWALDHRERGIWGKTNEDDRREIQTGRKPRSHAARDPKGMSKQERARVERVKIARNLKDQGIEMIDIAKEIGVATSTVYDYFRYDRKNSHGASDPGTENQAGAEAEGSGSSDSERSEAPLLKATGS